jgi:hypothetical protein
VEVPLIEVAVARITLNMGDREREFGTARFGFEHTERRELPA